MTIPTQPDDESPDSQPRGINTSIANGARVYDYLLGGKDNFEADRRTAAEILNIEPRSAAAARQNREYMTRVVTWLAGQGVTQFLDIGTGIPTGTRLWPAVHEIAQHIIPACRVVYVDNDPVVLSHARALLASGPEGLCAYADVDLREPEHILQHAGKVLDLRQPVGLLLLGVLHFIPDADDPWGIVNALMRPLSPDSFLAISHGSVPDASQAEALAKVYSNTQASGATSRTVNEIGRFFHGMWVAPPGVVDVSDWHPEVAMGGSVTKLDAPFFWGGVGKKNP